MGEKRGEEMGLEIMRAIFFPLGAVLLFGVGHLIGVGRWHGERDGCYRPKRGTEGSRWWTAAGFAAFIGVQLFYVAETRSMGKALLAATVLAVGLGCRMGIKEARAWDEKWEASGERSPIAPHLPEGE